MPRPPSISTSVAHWRVGRAALHLACLLRGRNVRWHCAGMVREIFGRRPGSQENAPGGRAAGRIFSALLSLTLSGVRVCAAEPALGGFELLPLVQVDGSGIFLHQIVAPKRSVPKNIRLSDAPTFGQTASLSRAQLAELLNRLAPELATNAWTGAGQSRISRRLRPLAEAELRDLLTATLQNEVVKDRGELELRFSRPWTPASVPYEPISLKVLDLPSSGIAPNFIARFEVVAGSDHVGPWQVVLQARLMKEVLVAKSTLKRGAALASTEVTTEKRDVISLREPLDASALNDPTLDLYEAVSPGQPLLARHVRARAVVQRGQVVDALMRDGSLSISLKVEALGDGAAGQTIRVRNPKTKREFYAKIQDEQTVLLSL